MAVLGGHCINTLLHLTWPLILLFNNDFPASAIEGDSVLYADDDTDNVHAKDVEEHKA